MTDETKKTGPDAGKHDTAVENPAEAVAAGRQDYETVEGGEAQTAEPDPIEAIRAENADLRDRFLRMAAEMENLRRRTERDVKDAKSYSVAAFARDMLAVSDNLRRAIDAVPAEIRAAADQSLTSLLEGVEMTERSMLSALERHGDRHAEVARHSGGVGAVQVVQQHTHSAQFGSLRGDRRQRLDGDRLRRTQLRGDRLVDRGGDAEELLERPSMVDGEEQRRLRHDDYPCTAICLSAL